MWQHMTQMPTFQAKNLQTFTSALDCGRRPNKKKTTNKNKRNETKVATPIQGMSGKTLVETGVWGNLLPCRTLHPATGFYSESKTKGLANIEAQIASTLSGGQRCGAQP